MVLEKRANVPTLSLRKKLAEGGIYVKKEEKKREKHTWAFLGRQILRGSTRMKNKSRKFNGRRGKRNEERRSSGEVELVGG